MRERGVQWNTSDSQQLSFGLHFRFKFSPDLTNLPSSIESYPIGAGPLLAQTASANWQ